MSNTNTNNQNTNTNTNNQNTQGGTNMNQNNFQVPQGVDPTMYMMMTMQQQSQENMMLMLQQMQNSNPNAALLQMALNNNQNNSAPKSALGQRLDDVNTFAAMITPSDADLTAAGDRAVAKAEADYNTAKAAVQALNPKATDAQIENVLKIMGKEPLTQAQIELIRAKAEEETINRKTESFNKAMTGLKAFESTMIVPSTPAPVSAPIPPAPSQQRRTFPETISDALRANAEAKIAWCKTAYNIK